MPGLSGRISTLTKAKISHLLDHAEDPAETLDYAYERQLEDLQSVKKGIADVVTAKKRLQLREEDLRRQADKLDGQAREAMAGGREDLARAALDPHTTLPSLPIHHRHSGAFPANPGPSEPRVHSYPPQW